MHWKLFVIVRNALIILLY